MIVIRDGNRRELARGETTAAAIEALRDVLGEGTTLTHNPATCLLVARRGWKVLHLRYRSETEQAREENRD